MATKLTARQEGFSLDRASGMNATEAYRKNYSNAASDKSINELACRLDSQVKIASRVRELQTAAESGVIKQVGIDLKTLILEAQRNLEGARASKAWSAANSALQMLAQYSGLNQDSDRGRVPITQVVIHTDAGVEEHQAVEGGYREMPEPLAEGG